MFTKSGNTFGTREFGTNQTTMNFFLICCATCNFYFYVWMYNLIKQTNEKQNVVNINPILALVVAGLSFWTSAIGMYFFFAAGALLPLVSLITFGLTLFISLKTRTAIHLILQQQNLYVPLNIILTIIFPLIYQYYCLRNAEERFAKKSGQAINAQATYDMGKSNAEKLGCVSKLS